MNVSMRSRICFLCFLPEIISMGACAKPNPLLAPVIQNPIRPAQAQIDNFDNNDKDKQNQLGGYWYTYRDANGTTCWPDPANLVFYNQGSPSSPLYSFRLYGYFGKKNKDTSIYAGLGTTLDPKARPVDLSGYQGIRFYARSPVHTRFILKIKKQSLGIEGVDFMTEIEANESWREFVIPFSSLHLPDNVPPVSLLLYDVLALQWVPVTDQSEFNLQIDDIELFR